MKKCSVILSCALAALWLALSASGSARPIGGQEGVRAGAPLETALDQLEQELKKSVALDFRMRYPRRTYTRLKRAGGCDIGFRVSEVPGGAQARDFGKPVAELSSAELVVNLSGLDPAGVHVEKPAKGDYRVIRFAAAGSRKTIKWVGFAPGDSRWASEGRIYVGEDVAPAVAEALGKAITACRE